ncbi:Syntaxin-31 [Turnera subulata]|uniref:Syntaxin-31 n=1 Tax=Turnera subulata TaxID=218843 RepID=A0A9Q0EZR9_9ROSI|nr:Syntaxin-31 [Turnera subulata]
MYDSGARTFFGWLKGGHYAWVAPRQENYSQSRAVALHNVESTITEVSGIFTHLATMVAQQGELAIRIDDNMDESLSP